MLTESPDKLSVNGKALTWYDGVTFLIFNTTDGKKTHIAISSGRGADFHLQINDINLTDYIKQKFPEWTMALDHESLSSVIHGLKPELINKNVSRKDFLISGRLWNVGGTNYISIWNDKLRLEANKPQLDKLMSLLKVTHQNTLFELPENQNDYKPYDKIVRVDKPASKMSPSEIKKAADIKKAWARVLATIHTTPPSVWKKTALDTLRGGTNGLSTGMSEMPPAGWMPLHEDPDHIRINNGRLTWESPRVTSVFSTFLNQRNNTKQYIIAFVKGGNAYNITTGNKYWDDYLDLKGATYSNSDIRMIHANMLDGLNSSGVLGAEISSDAFNLRNLTDVSGRSWFKDGIHYISVWNTLTRCKENLHQIDNVLRELGAEHNNILFEFIDFPSKLLTYDEAFLGKSKVSTLTPDQIKDLMKKQHLDPNAKKILMALASGDKHLNVLQRTAANMGISLVQLKNMMISGD